MAEEKTSKRILGLFPRRVEQVPQIEVFDEFERLRQQFASILNEVDSRWNPVVNWMYVISNAETGENLPSIIENGKRKGLLETYNKKWIAFRLALDLYRILITDTARFSSEKQQYLSRIRLFDPELAKRIMPIVVSGNGALGILAPIRGMANQQVVVSYVKTRYDDFMRQIDGMQDKKAADKLRKLVIVLSNREIEELVRCINDIRNWPYRAAYDIPFFIERGFLFLNGGRSKYENVSFLGFNVHFRDTELVTEMKSSSEVRKLLTYMQEIQFFKMTRDAIKRSVETEGKWEGFYEFYNNLKKGKNYIKIVRERFGNEEFARLLEAFEEKKHEAPIAWESELENLDQQLIHRAYQLVVEPAAQALIKIFEARIRKLEQEKGTGLADLQKLIAEQDSSLKARGTFLRLLAKRREELRKEMENERREFENLMETVISAMPNFEDRMKQVDKITEANNELVSSAKVMNSLRDWQKFVAGHLNMLKGWDILENRTITSLLRATFGGYKSMNIAERILRIKGILEWKYEQGIKLLQSLIQTSNEVILPSVEKCRSHIDSRLSGYTGDVTPVLNRADQTQDIPQLKVQPLHPTRNEPLRQAA